MFGYSNTFRTQQFIIFILSGLYFSFPGSAMAETGEIEGNVSAIELSKIHDTVAPNPLSSPPPLSEKLLAGHPGEGTEPPPKKWGVYGQFTSVSQYHPSFTAPYSAKNSLSPNSAVSTTNDLTLFAGIRLFDGGELWINPEIDQGFGLSDTVGIAGFPSGEAYKVGENAPYLRLPRLFYRQVINLEGEEQPIESSANQLGGTQSVNNIIVTLGKFSVTDVFDTNTYAHDPRADFFNWSIVESGAFDYAADAWGFTKGFSIEWTQSKSTIRGGFFALSQTPNTTVLDQTFTQHEWVGEFEQRVQFSNHPGKVKLLGFINQGNMGSYQDALLLQQQTNSSMPDTALVRRFSSRPGMAVNVEQEVSSVLGVFGRASMNNGSKEADDFTEINKSIVAGLSLKGDHWGRHDDTFGLATVVNSLSGDAQAYFAAGGMGILIGDGHLKYGQEKILESYYSYSVPAVDHLMLTLNFQYVVNPAYNQDRGPVSLFGVRVHKEF